MSRLLLAALCIAAVLTGCSKPEAPTGDMSSEASATPEIAPKSVSAESGEAGLLPYQSLQLENGLTVLFHIDRSDPVVAVSLTAHVGSARELPGRTGFAHLFEHLLFLESENLGPGGLDKLSARIGGSGANGSTSRDRTNYLQTVPKDALEKMLWAEADKLGWFINTVTDTVLEKEKQVVKNEKRQSVDNRPYGHVFYVLHKALYPEDHPYNWQVIGSLDDLQAATLEDVKDFYRSWYGPNNVTLVVAGDFDPDQARQWVDRYFAEIPSGPLVKAQTPRPGVVEKPVLLFHEDNLATLPQLTITWPTVENYHPDSYALSVLVDLLSEGKEATLNAVLVDEDKVAGAVNSGLWQSELAGELIIRVNAFDGVDLDTVLASLDKGFARFEEEPITETALERIKTQREVAFYSDLSTVLGKGEKLAEYSLFAGNPGYIDEDLRRLKAVTAEDVRRVYDTYLKGRGYVAASFVPEGSAALAIEGSTRASVVIEPIVQGAEADVNPLSDEAYVATPSKIDRSIEPAFGDAPKIPTPDIWEATAENGMGLKGIYDDELPLVNFALVFDGGHNMDSPATAGTANLVAELLTKGTATKTTAELDEAFALLGADIDVVVTPNKFEIRGQTLSRNFTKTVALVEEALLNPRWDTEEFELATARTKDAIQASRAQPNAIAQQAFNLVTYGPESMRSRSVLGSESNLDTISLDDLKAWRERALAPQLAQFRVVGDITEDEAVSAIASLASKWERNEVTAPTEEMPELPEEAKIYFYDVPGASQSVFRFGYPALTREDPNYDIAEIINYRLGGGGFASRLTQELREGKGYTYGIRSRFNGGTDVGEFVIQSGVRSNITLEAAALVRDILGDYPTSFGESDLAVTQSFYSKSQARRFESLEAKMQIVSDVADYNLPNDYKARQVEMVKQLTVDDLRQAAGAFIKPGNMNYVIVGDAATQFDRLKQLGLGEPILINEAVDALTR